MCSEKCREIIFKYQRLAIYSALTPPLFLWDWNYELHSQGDGSWKTISDPVM